MNLILAQIRRSITIFYVKNLETVVSQKDVYTNQCEITWTLIFFSSLFKENVLYMESDILKNLSRKDKNKSSIIAYFPCLPISSIEIEGERRATCVQMIRMVVWRWGITSYSRGKKYLDVPQMCIQ